jgi:hypothetical protein
MDHAALKHLREFKDLSSRVMRWATYLAPLTFGIKFRPGIDNVSDYLSRIDLEDMDYKCGKNLELQEGLSYLSLAMSQQEATEEKKINEMEVEEAIVFDKPPPTQKMLKWLQWIENWYLTRKWMLQNDERFQILPKDWKRAAIAQKSILKLEQNGEEYDLYFFNQGIWKRCLHAMELFALCQDMHEQGHQSWSTTALQLKKDYWAPHLMQITKVIVSGCDICRRYALRMKKLVELMSQFRGLHPFAQVSMDFIGPHDQTRSGNRYILLLVDHKTQFAVALA